MASKLDFEEIVLLIDAQPRHKISDLINIRYSSNKTWKDVYNNITSQIFDQVSLHKFEVKYSIINNKQLT